MQGCSLVEISTIYAHASVYPRLKFRETPVHGVTKKWYHPKTYTRTQVSNKEATTTLWVSTKPLKRIDFIGDGFETWKDYNHGGSKWISFEPERVDIHVCITWYQVVDDRHLIVEKRIVEGRAPKSKKGNEKRLISVGRDVLRIEWMLYDWKVINGFKIDYVRKPTIWSGEKHNKRG